MPSISRYIGKMLIPQFVQQGLSAMRIIEQLSGMSRAYRYQDMLSDIKEQQGLFETVAAVRALPDNRRPPKDVMVEIPFSRPRKYRVIGVVEYQNRMTGDIMRKTASFYSDKLQTKDDWTEDYFSKKDKDDSEPEYAALSFDIFAIEHFAGMSY
jgi:hypothetical protein